MGMLYSQLTEGERNHIYALLQEDVSLRRIAVIPGRGSSTIGRELRRNHGQRGRNSFRHEAIEPPAEKTLLSRCLMIYL